MEARVVELTWEALRGPKSQWHVRGGNNDNQVDGGGGQVEGRLILIISYIKIKKKLVSG